MSEIHHIAGAELITSTPRRGRTPSEEHALSFLARYRVELTRRSYEIALRQWFTWCETAGVEPLDATRTHIELFARELEVTGRQIATVATKLNVLAGFYKYAVIDGLIDDNPMLHVHRPQIQRISTTLGLTRTEFADVLRAAEQTPPPRPRRHLSPRPERAPGLRGVRDRHRAPRTVEGPAHRRHHPQGRQAPDHPPRTEDHVDG